MISKKQKNELFQALDSICDELRKSMDASEYRNYILGFIFYKYLSENFINKANKLLENDGVTYFDLNDNDDIKNILEKRLQIDLGYLINQEHLFHTWVKKINDNENVLSLIEESLKNLEESSYAHESEDDFRDLFSDINISSSKLGNSEEEKNKRLSHVIIKLSEIDFSYDDAEIDILGDAYEHLIANFAKSAGKKAGEFYTPQEVSTVLARIVTSNKKDLRSAYDPTCGSGSLLLQVSKLTNVGTLYGQEMKSTTYNLARMNMFLRGKKFHEFNIKNQDTILHPQHTHDKSGNIMKFDAIVANPPFSLPWSAPESMLSDQRFNEYGKLAPKSKMDYAFIQHMLFHLSDEGIMASVVPHGVLFRSASEGTIRTHIIKNKNWLDAVIGLPANIFYGTTIPSCILVFRKNRNSNDKVLFIDASAEFIKGKNQNILSQDNVNKIVDTYIFRKDIEKYSRNVSLDEISKNDFNLNITRYIDTFEEEEEIDINKINLELKSINKELSEIEKEIEDMLSELVEVN